MKKSVCIALLLLPFLAFSQQNSVLSNGDWYKIAVEETGVYKITYNDLVSYGIAVDQIDPRNISLFGNKTGMIPESYDETPYTDLQQMAILVVGEEDGLFQPGDYILFYGQSPNVWKYNSSTNHFDHEVNLYSYSTSYFLTVGNEPGKRISLKASASEAQNKTIDTLDLLLYHEKELVNLAKSGKIWLGETFENTTPLPIEFDLSGYEVYQNGHFLQTTVAAKSSALSDFNLKTNDVSLTNIAVPYISQNNYYQLYKTNNFDTTFSTSEPNLQISFTYNLPNDSSTGWLDFLDLNLKIAPKFHGSQMGFRSTQNIGEGTISYYYLNDEAPENLVVWNVSDPVNVENMVLNIETGKISFKIANDNLLEFQAFNSESFFTPEFIGQIENQNLHAATPPDFLIITYPEFQAQASQMAMFHEIEDGMSTGVFTTEQVYNEFSSGSQDISAIRNFIWYLNDISGEENQPKYVLLFGDASYDYKNITENNTNFVPTFETLESANMVNSFATDRFFSMKNMQDFNKKQLSVGRMPLATTQQAVYVLQKIETYASNQSLGFWKNEMMFIADDADAGLHESQANQLANIADSSNPVMNFTKCYLDFFELVETEAGPRYPEANAEIQNKVNEGVYYINYTGHGGAEQLAAERILAKNDLPNWTNSDKLSLWVIASGDVASYTNPEFISLGEAIYLEENAGAIGVISTTGANFASANYDFNKRVIEKLTDESLQGNMRFGDLLSLSNLSSNDFKWIFLGDPALKIRFPEFNIVSTKINDVAIETFSDTIAPGSNLSIQGEIVSKQDGSPQFDFNGTVYLKVFAPPYLRSTLGNQGTPVQEFVVQDSILAFSEATVVNGNFEIQVTLPAQYYPDYGNLKLSWYAENGETDANGFYSQLMFGGQPNAIAEGNEFFDRIKVYPTLFVDHLYIETPVATGQTINYRVYGTMGNMLYENTLESGNGMAIIDLPGLAKGMYILNIENGIGSKNFKILKQ